MAKKHFFRGRASLPRAVCAVLLLAALLCALCAMESVSSPLTAPVTPPRRANPDFLIRLPMKFQKARAFFARSTDT